MAPTTPATATEQRRAIADVLQAIEGEMVALSGDPTAFAGLRTRRDRLKAEATRLDYRERQEAIEAEAAHREAVGERLRDIRQRSRAAVADFEVHFAELEQAAEAFDRAARAVLEAGAADERLAIPEMNALDAARKLGIPVDPPHPTVSGMDRINSRCRPLAERMMNFTAALLSKGLADPVHLINLRKWRKVEL